MLEFILRIEAIQPLEHSTIGGYVIKACGGGYYRVVGEAWLMPARSLAVWLFDRRAA